MDIVATAQARETGNSPHQLFVTPPRRPDQMIVAQLSYWSVSYRQLATGSLFAYIVHRRNPPTRNVQCNLILVWWSFVNCVSVLWTIVAFPLFFSFFFFPPVSYLLFIVSTVRSKKRIYEPYEKRLKIEHCRITRLKGTSNISVIFIMIGNFLPVFLKCDNSRTFYLKGRPTVKTCRWKRKRISLENQFSLYILPSFFLPKELRSLRNRGQKFFFWSQRI